MKRVVVRVSLAQSTWAVLYHVLHLNFISFVLTLSIKIVCAALEEDTLLFYLFPVPFL